jgi:hypothetical protein
MTPNPSCQGSPSTKQSENSCDLKKKKKPLETAYFKIEDVIEGKLIPIYNWSSKKRVKCWYFYVYKGVPSPSGIQVKVVHRTPTRTLYYWTIEYSGIEGDAKNAGVPYGIRVTRKPFKKKLPKYIRVLIWRLLRLKRHEIKTSNQENGHGYKEKAHGIAQAVLRRFGIADPRGMRPLAPIRKRPKKGDGNNR